MKKIKILICLSVLFLAGCYDSREPNETAFVTAMGIDRASDDTYNVTIQFAKPDSISGGASEEGGSGQGITENITVEAPNIYSAVGLADQVVSKNMSLSHMKLFVISKEIAESGISEFIDIISRSDEIRPNVYVTVCSGCSRDYLKNILPVVEKNPAKYYQLIFDKKDFSAIPKTFSHQLYFYSSASDRSIVLPLSGVAEESENGENTESASAKLSGGAYEFKIRDYKAGQIGVFEDKNSETVGCAVFRGDKMVGELGLIETQIYNMLINDFTRNYITFKSEKAELPITITLGLDDRTKIHYDKQTHTAKINVKLDGDFISLPDDYITEDDLKSFEDTVSTAVAERTKSFLEKTRDEFCSDIVGIGAAAKSTFLTNSDFESYGWQDRYGNISFDVTVDFKVRRTGLTSRTETK